MLLLLINSCRTNEIVENENTKKEKIEAFVKYYEKLKTSKTTDQNYNKPFAKILANYLNKHDDYRTIFENEIGIIDLSKSSQTFDNGSKIVLFPLINNQNDIVNILCCYINEDLDFVEFDVLENSLIKTEIINTFKNYKTKNIAKEKINESNIEEVIITQPIPKNPKNSHLIFPYSNNEIPEIMNGGADIHNGGGGGSYDGNLEEMLENKPCDNTNDVVNNQELKEKKSLLLNKSKLVEEVGGGELGVAISQSGSTSPIITGSNHSITFPTYPINYFSEYRGGYHNHTVDGIKMFSSNDIIVLIHFANFQPLQNTGNAFFGMIAAEGNTIYDYTISFTGTKTESEALYLKDWDTKILNEWYIKKTNELKKNPSYYNSLTFELNSKGLEKLFFELLKQMNLEDKIALNKIDELGNIKSIKLSKNNEPHDTPCLNL